MTKLCYDQAMFSFGRGVAMAVDAGKFGVEVYRNGQLIDTGRTGNPMTSRRDAELYLEAMKKDARRVEINTGKKDKDRYEFKIITY